MKILSDGTEVIDRTYYYLLDFNEANRWDYMTYEFGKLKLHDLTETEYWKLFKYANGCDIPIGHL